MSNKSKNSKQDKPIDVKYTEVNNENSKRYFEIDEVCKELDVEQYKITYWCKKLNDILNIQGVGTFMIFTENDVRNLKTIKNLDFHKNMSIEEIRQYMNEHKNEIILKKDSDIQTEISLISVLAKIMNNQNDKIEALTKISENLLQANQQILENQEKNKEEIKEHIAVSIEENLKTQLSEVKGYLDSKELEAKNRDIEMIDMMKRNMEERKKDSENKEKQSKGFFSKLLGK